MYVTLRKYRLKQSYPQVREIVSQGLVPILQAASGFEGYWLLQCDDGDVAGVSIFDTEAHATAANDKTRAWVTAHVRELVVLPAEAMFGAAVDKLA